MTVSTVSDDVRSPVSTAFDAEWDAGDMGCGELLLKLRKKLRQMPGQVIRLVALDRGAIEDIPSYCRITGHQLLLADPEQGVFLIRAKV